MRILKLGAVTLVLLAILLGILLVRTWQTPPLEKLAPRAFTALPVASDAALQRFAGAVKLHTISTAEGPPSEQDLDAFHDYLAQQFPLVHQHLQREVLPGGALLFTWPGSASDRRPIILMAHQDTVPIEPGTESKWNREPFSGEIADGMVWGRGALDDKASLVSILEATEILLTQHFTPNRTLYFAFGNDEERGGKGAAAIAELLKQRKVNAQFVLDEGGAVTDGMLAGVDGKLALIGVAEKGFLTVGLTVKSTGGHSSAPPKETAIGILSGAMSRLENSQMPMRLAPPVDSMFDTIAPLLPFAQRLVVRNRWLLQPLLLNAMQNSPTSNGTIRTTTAETMFNAGIKDNVLPTEAHATVNFRLLPGDRIDDVLAHIHAVVNDDRVSIEPNRDNYREASPVSALDGEGFKLVRATIADVLPDVPISPFLVTAATDSSHYTGVSQEQLRFVPYTFTTQAAQRFHGINEAIPTDDYLRCVRFIGRLITTAAGPETTPPPKQG
jgi:carboxypeptidase PM20D1